MDSGHCIVLKTGWMVWQYKGGRAKCPYSMNTTEKLVFIASFMWMMQWGTRVTSAALHALS
mgnify:CR=1 FL=1